MSESLLDDLQHVQLMVKEHHRRKRRLEKLNKTKRHKFLKYTKYEEFHQKKHNKYFNIYVEYEIKSIYNNNDILMDIEDEIITTTTTATVIINENENNNNKSWKKRKKKKQKEEIKKKLEKEDPDEISLSSCFEAIEYDLHNNNKNKKEIINLDFPAKYIYHISSLYERSRENDINGLLKSARYWKVNRKDTHKDIEGQAVVIGSYLHELINILTNIISDCPIDIIYIISELVGNAIIWLRKPGLNIFKWSAKKTISYKYKTNTENNIRKLNFEYHAFDDNEFYFSGYVDFQVKELVLLNDDCMQYLDLDWFFVVFLLLGLIPKNKNHYFRWYFSQKLLSAFPGTYPFKLLLNT